MRLTASARVGPSADRLDCAGYSSDVRSSWASLPALSNVLTLQRLSLAPPTDTLGSNTKLRCCSSRERRRRTDEFGSSACRYMQPISGRIHVAAHVATNKAPDVSLYAYARAHTSCGCMRECSVRAIYFLSWRAKSCWKHLETARRIERSSWVTSRRSKLLNGPLACLSKVGVFCSARRNGSDDSAERAKDSRGLLDRYCRHGLWPRCMRSWSPVSS